MQHSTRAACSSFAHGAHRRLRLILGLAAGLGLLARVADAESEARAPGNTAPAELHADVEIDPTAYVFNGNSLHVGLGYAAWRLDLGNFALDVPKFAEANSGFSASGSGYGTKLQWFPFAEQGGLVLGLEAAVARFAIVEQSTRVIAAQKQVSAGINAGYRLLLPASFYLTFWAGLSYNFGAADVRFEEATYVMNPWRLFPAIHIGYRLR